jgi:thiol-disulfide isomerase/thioredoxin
MPVTLKTERPVNEEQQRATATAPPGGRWVILALAGLLFAGVLYLGVLEARRSPMEGVSAPSFKLERYLGGSLALEDLRGRVVMLDFWATWCPPCVAEMPSLVKLAREYEPKGLAFVAANRDEGDTARLQVKRFLTKHAPDLAPDIVFADDVTASRYQVRSLPMLYFIDRDGKVLGSYAGLASESALRKQIEQALAAR